MTAAGGRLAVLMATFNGARFIDEQLRSIDQQTWPIIDVWASDDGSTDGTLGALERWAVYWSKGDFMRLPGPGRGFAANFRSLLTNTKIDADYVAFCDQDDVWLTDKTQAAVAALEIYGSRPALYCARTIITDADGEELSRSPLFRRPPDFANALVQSIGGGNTMVLNRAAHQLLREAATRTGFVSHDWFAYLIVAGGGGRVIYDGLLVDPLWWQSVWNTVRFSVVEAPSAAFLGSVMCSRLFLRRHEPRQLGLAWRLSHVARARGDRDRQAARRDLAGGGRRHHHLFVVLARSGGHQRRIFLQAEDC